MHSLVVTDRAGVELPAGDLDKGTRGRRSLAQRVQPPARDRAAKGGLAVLARLRRGPDRARVLVTGADGRLVNIMVETLRQLTRDLVRVRVHVRHKPGAGLDRGQAHSGGPK